MSKNLIIINYFHFNTYVRTCSLI